MYLFKIDFIGVSKGLPTFENAFVTASRFAKVGNPAVTGIRPD